MKPNIGRGPWILLGTLVPVIAFAEEYDFEIGLDYGRTNYDGSQLISTTGGAIFSATSIETDAFSAFGSWYFAGLSDDRGPRAKAAFVDRASSLRIGLSHADQTASFLRRVDDPSSPIRPFDSVSSPNADAFTADVRYVDRESGWFGNAGLLTSSGTSNRLDGFIDDSSDAGGWSLGVGKYLFETTALSLDIGEVDADFRVNSSVLAVTFTHLGNLGEAWQYAIDLGYSRVDWNGPVDLDTWGATFALYPTRDLEFGISIEDERWDGSSFVNLDATSVQGFASWYAKPNVELAVRYSVDDLGFFPSVVLNAPTVREADQDSFGISATIRF